MNKYLNRKTQMIVVKILLKIIMICLTLWMKAKISKKIRLLKMILFLKKINRTKISEKKLIFLVMMKMKIIIYLVIKIQKLKKKNLKKQKKKKKKKLQIKKIKKKKKLKINKIFKLKFQNLMIKKK